MPMIVSTQRGPGEKKLKILAFFITDLEAEMPFKDETFRKEKATMVFERYIQARKRLDSQSS